MSSRIYTANDRPVVWANTITVTAAAYTAGNNVGGKWQFPNVMGINGSGVIEQLTVIDRSAQKPALDFLVFGSDITSTVTDKATPTIVAADDAKCLGSFQIPASQYLDFTGFSIATYVFPIPFKLIPPSKDLFLVPVVRTTPTFTGTGVIKAFITIRKD